MSNFGSWLKYHARNKTNELIDPPTLYHEAPVDEPEK
jgi:hypothetical protein